MLCDNLRPGINYLENSKVECEDMKKDRGKTRKNEGERVWIIISIWKYWVGIKKDLRQVERFGNIEWR